LAKFVLSQLKRRQVKLAEKQGLSAKELLEGVYEVFENEGRKIKLPSKATAEIADDSDWHRDRRGYTGYESATLLKIGDKEWLIAFGTKCGGYPADPYNCDIATMQFFGDGKSDELVATEAYDALKENRYFRKSIIYAMASGQLMVKSGGCFSNEVIEFLSPRVYGFIAQELETNLDCLTMDGRPVVTTSTQYKPEFVAFLYDAFRKILAT
jgi:hypothetical protein